MKKNVLIVLIVVGLIILNLAGCITDTNDSKDDDIPSGLYVSSLGDKEFKNIQDAIDSAQNNETVYVFSGLYNESIVINKTIRLLGENPSTTIINGIGSEDIITVTNAESCNISGFTIQNSDLSNAGIKLNTPKNNVSNNILKNNYDGIYANNANKNFIYNNSFVSNSRYGIYLSSSDDNVVKNNLFSNNDYGIRIKARYNKVMENQFLNNEKGLFFCCYAEKNTAYRNTFINNSDYNGKDTVDGATWYNSKISQGNYWDDYMGIDADNDGIGDTPYNITSDGSEQDRYPLITPLT